MRGRRRRKALTSGGRRRQLTGPSRATGWDRVVERAGTLAGTHVGHLGRQTALSAHIGAAHTTVVRTNRRIAVPSNLSLLLRHGRLKPLLQLGQLRFGLRRLRVTLIHAQVCDARVELGDLALVRQRWVSRPSNWNIVDNVNRINKFSNIRTWFSQSRRSNPSGCSSTSHQGSKYYRKFVQF